MPELPEVETIRRHLEPAVVGRVLERLEILDPRWCEPAGAGEVEAAVAGRHIEALERRGKYLVWVLREEVFLVVHLRMTGNFLYEPAEPPRFTRARFELSGGATLYFCDQRRFGTGIVLLGEDALEEFFASRLGVEPLSPDFTGDALRALAKGRRAPVKAFLLSQERIAGVGNIYADEALFRARIHPLRAVGTLKRAQLVALRDAVVETLELGIDSRGATIDDYRHPDGASGSFQTRFLVHLREGEPCPNCGRAIEKLRAAGRGTYVCPRCQPKPRGAPRASRRGRRPTAP